MVSPTMAKASVNPGEKNTRASIARINSEIKIGTATFIPVLIEWLSIPYESSHISKSIILNMIS
jgi:hypothetical protein